METKEALAEKYLAYRKTEREAYENARNTLKELSLFAEHPIGEIIKCVETKTRNVGLPFHPIYEKSKREVKAVVVGHYIDVDGAKNVYYNYKFRAIKANGGLCNNRYYPRESQIEWTGEMYDLINERYYDS